MVSRLIFVLFFAFTSKSSFGIQEGVQASSNQLPFVVDIGNCSGSLIGPDTLLTAARCLRGNSAVRFVFDNTSYVADCEAHPNWSSGKFDFDVALCKISVDVRKVQVLARIEAVQVAHQGRLVFAGFGDGRLRFANLQIRDIFSQTFTADGNGWIQAGDVGGPAIVDVDDLVVGPFKILGVGVGIISHSTKTLFARIDAAQKFFQDFIRKRNARICGLNDECRVNNELCQNERDIVDFFERELLNAKLLLRQCLEQHP